MQLNGEIIACYRNILTGRETQVHEQKNLHMYEAADIMAGLLIGDLSYRISHMYLEYQNTNGAVSIAPTLTRQSGRSSFNAITGAGPDFHDWLRIPILTNGRLQKIPDDSVDYAGNGAVFNATSGASESMAGESPAHNYYGASGVNGPSKIFAVGLVAAKVANDSKQDKVFSRVVLTSPITMQPGHQISVYWLQKFN